MPEANQPHCNICGHKGSFLLAEKGRDGTVCANCGSSSRHRAFVYAISLELGTSNLPVTGWKPNKNLLILESSGRGGYPMLFKDKFQYYNTEFSPGSPLMHQPFTPYADFQKLSYPDNTLDYVLATDVFEHVREDDKGFAEIYRTLKPGGTFIMTVPYRHTSEETEIRVKVEGDKDIQILPPEYHGGGGQTLAYRTYGRDLMDKLRSYGFAVGYLELDLPQYAISPQCAFIATKSSYLDLKKYHAPASPGSTWDASTASPLLPFRMFIFFKYNMSSVWHFGSEIVRRLKDKF